MGAVGIDRGVSEDVFRWTSHGLLGVFVAEGSHVVTDAGSALSFQSIVGSLRSEFHVQSHQLLFQWHLLELHAMDASIGGTEQRSCCNDEAVLHRR